MNVNTAIRFGFIACLLQGCHLGPRYAIPESSIPEDWKTVSSTEQTPCFENWWEVFEDELLISLEKQVIAENPDLYTAMEKVAEARAVAGVSKADLYPQASLQPSYNTLGALIELYGVPPNLSPGLKTIVRVHEMTYELPLNMSYEVDLWKKNRGKYDAATFNAQAKQEAFRTTLLTLTSDLASHYFNARSLDRQIELLEQIVQINQDLCQLKNLRFVVGLDSYIEVCNATQQLEIAKAEYDDVMRQRALFENAIAVLIGCPASQFTLDRATLTKAPPQIPAGLPSSLLIQRPDIAQAERNMAAEHALIGVAYASFFPSLNLTGMLGFLSPELSKFLTWQGHLWGWGANVFETIFDGWRNSSALSAAYARFRETEGMYKKVVLTAFQEVEDALNNIEQEAKRAESLLRSMEFAESNVILFSKRFMDGVSNRIDVLNQQLNRLQIEQRWTNALGLRYQSTVQLIKALGGSWNLQIIPRTA